ncbi:S1C family serine protease, partial [Candidatus Saccharibacteria bacterium]|nr:S1C family serine protease [Candidatus Saccharibacteria bacterium]
MAEEKDQKTQRPSTYSTRPQPIINMDALKARTQGLKTKRPKSRISRGVALLLVVCLLFGFAAGFLGSWIQNRDRTTLANSTAAKQQYISNQSELLKSIAKNVGQSVVSIDVTGESTATDFFGIGQTEQTRAAGTGFIISPDGIIVTNRHVVPAGTTAVSVTLADG